MRRFAYLMIATPLLAGCGSSVPSAEASQDLTKLCRTSM